MTTAEKAECVALWEAGEVTIDDLARRFKRDPATISKALADAKAVRGSTSKEVIDRARTKVAEDAASEASKIAGRIRETKEEHYALSRNIVIAVAREIRENSGPGRDLGNRAQTLKAYESAMKVLKMAREERYAVLGILDGEDLTTDALPDLVIQELSADDVATLRSMGGEEGMDDVGGEEEISEELGDEDLDIEGDDAVMEGGDD